MLWTGGEGRSPRAAVPGGTTEREPSLFASFTEPWLDHVRPQRCVAERELLSLALLLASAIDRHRPGGQKGRGAKSKCL